MGRSRGPRGWRRLATVALCAGVVALAAAPVASAEHAPYVAHQVIVKYASGASEGARAAAQKRGGVQDVVGRVTGLGAQVVRVSGAADAAAAALNRSGAVQYAEPDYLMHALATPNDPLFGQLYGLAEMQAPAGWDAAGLTSFPSGDGVKVGIVDTGVDANHEDLVGQTADCAGVSSFGILGGVFGADPTIVAGKCVDDNDHGTHVAGTVAAIANNGKGVAGVAFNSRLSICKALNSSGSGAISGVANCIRWAAQQGVKVISMSLGGSASTTLQQAVQAAWNNGNGAVVVAAAGNDGNSTVSYPAGYPEVVSVAAIDSSSAHASFSNANSDVEVSAAGVNVLSTKRGGGYVQLSGTSMATPHAAGVAALIAFHNPTWTAAQVRSKLDAATDDLGPAGRDSTYGFGAVDLVKAMAP
jgi:thermitase